MRQLRDIWRLNDTENVSSGHLGIIYLSWQFPTDVRKNHLSAQHEKWRVFAENEVKAAFGSSLLFEGLQWMKEDLFIHMRLPAGHQLLQEDWLLELAYKHTADWEKQFAEEICYEGLADVLGKLHIGVSVVPNDNDPVDGLVWYDAMKKQFCTGNPPDRWNEA